MRELTLVVCLPVYDRGENTYYEDFNRLLVPGRVDPRTEEKIAGKTIGMRKLDMPIREARTRLTQEALAGVPEADYILWIDSDMTFAPDSALRLIERAENDDLDIVGGLCFNRRHPYGPTLFKRFPKTSARDGYGICYHYPKEELFEVDATGAGFVLIRPRVYQELRAVRGDTWYMPLKGELSEDIGFCARAKMLDFRVHVDTGVKIGHIAKVVVDEDFAERNRVFEQQRYWSPEDVEADDDRGTEPRATVVIPVYNQKPEYLNAAIISAAYQTVPVEVVVVDDGSDTPVVLPAGMPGDVRLIRLDENGGIAAALNEGIAHMTTDWFCWLSSDDLFDSRKVQFQLGAAQQSGAKALYTKYQIAHDDPGFATVPHAPTWRDHAEQKRVLGQYCAIFGSTIMVHRDVIAEMGLFDANYHYGQDWEWFCRVGQRYAWQGLEEVLATRREDNNLTAQIADDHEKAAVRDAEDARIRARYGQ